MPLYDHVHGPVSRRPWESFHAHLAGSIAAERLANLHNVVIQLAEKVSRFAMEDDPPIYVVAYRLVRRNEEDFIDHWPWPLAVGSELPTVPLALKGFGCVALDLEASYNETCERCSIPS